MFVQVRISCQIENRPAKHRSASLPAELKTFGRYVVRAVPTFASFSEPSLLPLRNQPPIVSSNTLRKG